MELEFLKNILSVPNPSGHEELLVEAIENWCSVSGVKCRKDGKGNLYLTKGSAGPGGFYPGMTAHLDSVIGEADGMKNEVADAVREKRLLEIVEEGGRIHARLDGKDVVTGCDDKNAIAIVLSMFQRLPRLKAALYVEEERGMVGSSASDFSFWDDVCWVLGFDSPGGNRASKSCAGTILYSDEFFEKYIEPVCSKHGVTSFNHEPYTDIKLIREKTGLETFNCRNGGIGCHSPKEYADFKTVCDSEELAYDLLTSVPTDARHVTEVKKYERPKPTYFRDVIGPDPDKNTDSDWLSQWLRGHRIESPRRSEPDDEPLSPMEHSDDDEASISLKFSDIDTMVKFMTRIEKIELPVDMDDSYSAVVVSGPLRALKRAYAVYHAVTRNRDEQSFAYLSKQGLVDSFWDEIEFVEDMPDIDDIDIDDKYGSIFGKPSKKPKTGPDEPEDVEFTIKDR